MVEEAAPVKADKPKKQQQQQSTNKAAQALTSRQQAMAANKVAAARQQTHEEQHNDNGNDGDHSAEADTAAAAEEPAKQRKPKVCLLSRAHTFTTRRSSHSRSVQHIQKFVEASTELMSIIEEVNEVEDSSREKKLSKEVSQSRSLSLSLVGVMSIHSYLVGC